MIIKFVLSSSQRLLKIPTFACEPCTWLSLLTDQPEVVAHRRLRLRRPDDRHRLRRLLLLLQGQSHRQEQHPL